MRVRGGEFPIAWGSEVDILARNSPVPTDANHAHSPTPTTI